jgi:chromosome segregation ATPase
MGLYQCQKCNAKFKVKLGDKKVGLGDAMSMIKSLEAQLLQAGEEKARLEERVKVLENERKRLFEDMETLISVARTINVLEGELMELKARKAELEEKINSLMKEKEELLKRIEDLKTQLEIKELEEKARVLESEVEALRAEEKSLLEKLAPPGTTGCGQ